MKHRSNARADSQDRICFLSREMRVLYASAKFTNRRRVAFSVLLVLDPRFSLSPLRFPGHLVILAFGNNNGTSHVGRPTPSRSVLDSQTRVRSGLFLHLPRPVPPRSMLSESKRPKFHYRTRVLYSYALGLTWHYGGHHENRVHLI